MFFLSIVCHLYFISTGRSSLRCQNGGTVAIQLAHFIQILQIIKLMQLAEVEGSWLFLSSGSKLDQWWFFWCILTISILVFLCKIWDTCRRDSGFLFQAGIFGVLFWFKGLVTFFAWIWFLVGVAIFVCFKGSSLSKMFATLSTGEGLIPLVNPLVFIQISSWSECFFTLIAGEWFFSCMDHFVSVAVSYLFER